MRLIPALFCALLLGSTLCNAQGIPDQWEFKNNYTMLEMGKEPLKNLYSDSAIHTIHLDFYDTNYWSLMISNYQNKINIPAKLTYNYGTTVIDTVGVRFKGQTSYSQVNGDKKSFAISLDWKIAGGDIKGYNTLNLQNCYQDESFIREVFYMHNASKHIPAAKAGYVHLFINNQDWGLYPNVQQLNKDYFSEWLTSNNGISWRCDKPAGSSGPGGPGFGNGTAALNHLGTDTLDYQKYYTLKYSDLARPWDTLMKVCDVLENTPLNQVETELGKIFDIDRAMWLLASEIAFTDDDGYVFKGSMDYWAFYEQSTGRLFPQDYDANTTFSTSKANTWSPLYRENNQNFPLMYVLWQVPSIRQRYLAHARTIMNESFNQTTYDNRVDYYKNMIDSLVQSDPKKLYTYAQFQSEINVLKSYRSTRVNRYNSEAEIAEVAPTIASASHYSNNVQWARPASNQSVDVRTSVTSTNGISAVYLYYSGAINGQFIKTLMYDDGNHNDGAANDGTYGEAIPGLSGGTWVRYYIEAAANNTAKSVSYMPVGAEHDVFVYLVEPAVATTKDIVINEIMAANNTAVADNNGDYDDWIEIHNKSNAAVDISGWSITDDQFNLGKHIFPTGTIINPQGYYILWADEDGSQGADHINFKLSAGGEELILMNTNMEIVDEVTWTNLPADSAYARDPNATGNFVVKYQTWALNNNWALGVENVIDESQVVVYPNPANDFIMVKMSENATRNIAEIELLDITGKKLSSVTASKEVQISTSTLAEGMYILRFGNVSKKFVVQH